MLLFRPLESRRRTGRPALRRFPSSLAFSTRGSLRLSRDSPSPFTESPSVNDAMLKDKEKDLSRLSRELTKAKKTGESTEDQARRSMEACKRLKKGGERGEERKKQRDGKQKGLVTQGEDGEGPKRGGKTRNGDKAAVEHELEDGENAKKHALKDSDSFMLTLQNTSQGKTEPRRRGASDQIQTAAGKTCEPVQSSPLKTPETTCGSLSLLPLPVSPSSRSVSSSAYGFSSVSSGVGLISPTGLASIGQRKRRATNLHDSQHRLAHARSNRASSKNIHRLGFGKRQTSLSCQKALLLFPRSASPNSRPFPSSPASPVFLSSSSSASSSASGSSGSSKVFGRSTENLSAAAFLATGGWDPLSDVDSDEELSSHCGDACDRSKEERNPVSPLEDCRPSPPMELRKEEKTAWSSAAWGDPWSDNEGCAESCRKSREKKADGMFRKPRQQEQSVTTHKESRKGSLPLAERFRSSLFTDTFGPQAPGSVYLKQEGRSGGTFCWSSGSQPKPNALAFPSAFDSVVSSYSSSVSFDFSTPSTEAFASLPDNDGRMPQSHIEINNASSDNTASFSCRRRRRHSEQKDKSLPSRSPCSPASAAFGSMKSRHTSSSARFYSSDAYPVSNLFHSSSGKNAVLLSRPPSHGPGDKESVSLQVTSSPGSSCLFRSKSSGGHNGQPPLPPFGSGGEPDPLRSSSPVLLSSPLPFEDRYSSSVPVPPPPPQRMENALSPSLDSSFSRGRFIQPSPVDMAGPGSSERLSENDTSRVGRSLSCVLTCPLLDASFETTGGGEAFPRVPPPLETNSDRPRSTVFSGISSVSYPLVTPITLYGTDQYASCPPSFYEDEDKASALPSSSMSSLVFPHRKKLHGKMPHHSFSSPHRSSPVLPVLPSKDRPGDHETCRGMAFLPPHTSHNKRSPTNSKYIQLFVVPCLSWTGGRYFSTYRSVSSAVSFDAFPVD